MVTAEDVADVIERGDDREAVALWDRVMGERDSWAEAAKVWDLGCALYDARHEEDR